VPILVLAVLGVTASLWIIHLTVTTGRYSDFEVLYASVSAFRHGGPLYVWPAPGERFATNMNPPHTIVLMAPLAWLPIREAAYVMWAMTLVSMIVVWRGARLTLASPWPLFAVLLAASAHLVVLRFVNLGWILAALTTIAWLDARAGRQARAGLLVGVLAGLKVFYLLFLPYWVWKRQWHALAWGAGGIAVLGSIGISGAGVQAYGTWLDALGDLPPPADPMNASLTGLAARLVSDPAGIRVISLGLSAAVVAVAVQRLRRPAPVVQEWAVVLTTMILLSPSGWIYYWPIIALPVAATGSPRLLAIGAGLAVVPPFVPTWIPGLGSLYTVALLLLWWSVLPSAPTPAPAVRPLSSSARREGSHLTESPGT
jgi:hypothetical protein